MRKCTLLSDPSCVYTTTTQLKNMAAVLVANPHSILMPSPTVGESEAKKRTKSALSKATTVTRGRRERPCDACRKRKSKCVINEGQKTCAACGVHGQECTFVEDPQPRKRRIEGEAKDTEALKRRLVMLSHAL